MTEDTPSRRITLVAAMRNEGPFVLEWLVYHRLIGFTDVIVCSNDCVDRSPELLDRLEEMGMLRHLRCTPGPDEKPQLVAYKAAEAVLPQAEGDWAMVLDADEFLNVHTGNGRVPDLIDAVPKATAFLLNWRIFGSSGRRAWSPDLVLGRFTQSAEREDASNGSFKTLFTRLGSYEMVLSPHGPMGAREDDLLRLEPVDGAGQPVGTPYREAREFLQLQPARWDLAQVNHYNTRTREDYLVKHARGGGITREWDRDWNWGAFNKNDVEDHSITRWIPGVMWQMAQLFRDAELRERYRECLEAYGDHVDSLRPTDTGAPGSA
ncbi:glycosyltransferase family 2 protein [Altericroceibacterium xinjiangense]|uniref:glycosyltransferase family 2 protein n=1 Tax=Altericroceibacterium xinjiangense TaxID=762261 RepID=UPI000F7F662F|nr:glycosyltransferase family 2 protein [Altericroceibacterium xinjiangense]